MLSVLDKSRNQLLDRIEAVEGINGPWRPLCSRFRDDGGKTGVFSLEPCQKERDGDESMKGLIPADAETRVEMNG